MGWRYVGAAAAAICRGGGFYLCSAGCEWSDCVDFSGDCTPGQRQLCPTSLYCGLAFRICGPSCSWMGCVEVGM